MKDSKSGYAIYQNHDDPYTSEVFFTEDCWKTYRSNYVTDTDPSNLIDGLCIEPDSENPMVGFFLRYSNLIILSEDNFKTANKFDLNKLMKDYQIMQIQLIGNKEVFVLTSDKDTKVDNKSIKCSKLWKSEDYGKTWKLLYDTKENRNYISSFKAFDKDNWIFSGYFYKSDKSFRTNMMKTSDGGQSFVQIFEPDRYEAYNNYDAIYHYDFLDKDNLIVCKNHYNLDGDSLQSDLSFFHLVKEYLNQTNRVEVNYFQTNSERSLIPPDLMFTPTSYTPIDSIPQDTLYWNKVEGAKEYKIKCFGTANIKSSGSFYPYQFNAFSSIYTERIDTVVTDTFLVMKDLKRNYQYFIQGISVNDNQESIASVLFGKVFGPSLLTSPNITSPKSELLTKDITFEWEPVENADSYHIVLSEFNNSFFLNGVIFVEKDLESTSLTINNLKPNKYYTFSIVASNKNDISNTTHFAFLVEDKVTVPEDLFSNSDFLIFPNPASDYIELIPPLEKRGLGGVLLSVEIFNIFGNCVLTVETQNFVSLQKIDISTLPAGVYFMRIGEKIGKFVKM
jgi:hypothetical protein